MKHIGVLIPDTNTIVEQELIKMITEDMSILTKVSFHFSRIKTNTNYAKDGVTFLREVYNKKEEAFKLLKFIPLEVIGFFCTSAIILQKVDNKIVPETINNIPCIEPLYSLMTACKIIKPKKVLLLSPYNQKMASFLENSFKEKNIPIYRNIFLNLNIDIDKYDLEQTKKQIITNLESNTDLIVISCTNFRTLEIISFFESKFGIPVISSNQSLFWAICKKVNIKCDKLKKYGTIFKF
ncbi:MAG: hypothetical protein COY72_00030 [Candidatus Nealsonbacteria bacterium CG_4_10_14_0_8_um_filter_35_10]|uniref:Asp/Glu racemase n=2 Tax=Candidatus Nealsoniibacteriota TaxID=1817911 RepID=A0A2M7R8G0_9BACT|nr:MAG: hypothetical protein COY72_00030 [Candidatus Nealsonbacteria bacterium CG_4_10_14_0_8_um_filter_35_10]PJB99508.1 MAG: hypothetical protein CO077_01370 [Candidatus Nealsonbacteria bacterium CG_4_9_14_0_8_um_filter_35_12]